LATSTAVFDNLPNFKDAIYWHSTSPAPHAGIRRQSVDFGHGYCGIVKTSGMQRRSKFGEIGRSAVASSPPGG
jgi:hypothetical protein